MRMIFRVCAAALVSMALPLQAAKAQDAVPEVGMWDRFEMSVSNAKSYGSPYTGVDLDVIYTRPDGSSFAFWGFYDGGTTWRARMMCDALGTWRYEARFSDGQPGRSGSFSCVPSDLPGMLSQDETNPRWLGFKGGKHVQVRSFHVGDRFFATNWPADKRLKFVQWARQQGYNMLSIASHGPNWMKDGRGNGWNTPKLWPLDAAEYRKMEAVMDLLEDHRMMIFPFAGFFGKLQNNVPLDAENQERYVRYFMARVGAYWNLMFNVMGPEMNRNANADRLGSLVQRYNVFDHPLGLHPFDDEYKQISAKAWSSVVVIQGLEMSTSDLPAFLNNMHKGLVAAYVPGKPVYAQETFWPGNTLQPDYSSATTIRKVGWTTLMAAASLNYGDMDGNSSSGFSGSMDFAQKVQSRHDIMKEIWDFFETVPFYRMNPRADLVNNGYCLAEPGREYLVYLHKRGKVDVAVSGGTYAVTWINAADTSDRRSGGTTQNGAGLTTPSQGDDWVLHLTRSGDTTSAPPPPPPSTDEPAPAGDLPQVSFALVQSSLSEGGTRQRVKLRLSRASTVTVTVPVQYSGSATRNGDYRSYDKVTFLPGELERGSAITPIEDSKSEAAETIVMTLGTPINATLGVNTVHTKTITDND